MARRIFPHARARGQQHHQREEWPQTTTTVDTLQQTLSPDQIRPRSIPRSRSQHGRFHRPRQRVAGSESRQRWQEPAGRFRRHVGCWMEILACCYAPQPCCGSVELEASGWQFGSVGLGRLCCFGKWVSGWDAFSGLKNGEIVNHGASNTYGEACKLSRFKNVRHKLTK